MQRSGLWLAAIIFPAILLMPSLVNIYVITDFQLHQEFIAQNLCVNKEKKDSDCHGTCYLKKKLKESNSQEAEIPKEKIREEMGSKYTVALSGLKPFIQPQCACVHFSPDEELQTSPLPALFRPPNQAV
jgi:hypothetical protein